MKTFQRIQNILIVTLLLGTFFYTGYYFGKRNFTFEIRKDPPKVVIENQYPNKVNVDFSLFWDVWEMVDARYLERPVDHQKMIYGAIDGMLKALDDPYTSFLPPQLNKEITDALNGTYQGIGAELSIKDSQLIVVSPLDGSPAKSAGIRPGDKILSINQESTFGLSVQEAVLKIRGDAGTLVNLKIQSGESEPREVSVTRGIITISSVSWEDKKDGTAYIRISRFGGDTESDWSKVVQEIDKSMTQLDSIIIDVRGNPGGYLQSAIYLAGEFYKDDIVIYSQNDVGEQEPLLTERTPLFSDVPGLFVLIDEGSASASEILASALKNKKGAVLIGKKTFGKGTIQEAIDFEDGSGVHLTVAKWLTSDKTWVHKQGIEPDVVVEITQEDIENQFDSQLQKAIELSKGY